MLCFASCTLRNTINYRSTTFAANFCLIVSVCECTEAVYEQKALLHPLTRLNNPLQCRWCEHRALESSCFFCKAWPAILDQSANGRIRCILPACVEGKPRRTIVDLFNYYCPGWFTGRWRMCCGLLNETSAKACFGALVGFDFEVRKVAIIGTLGKLS